MNSPVVLTAGGASHPTRTSTSSFKKTNSSPLGSSYSSSSPVSTTMQVNGGTTSTRGLVSRTTTSSMPNDNDSGNANVRLTGGPGSDEGSDGLLSYDEEENMEEEQGNENEFLLSNNKSSETQIDDLYSKNMDDDDLNDTDADADADHNNAHDDTNNGDLSSKAKFVWLAICFFGIMFSFVGYGLLLEYATSGGRKLHELSFLFVTSLLYTCTAAAGRYVRDETPTTIPPARFAILGITSMGSTFCSVRSLRYVIFPIQVLAKSCKPVPVMIMGAFMGKKYPLKKYFNVCLIVGGVGLFMGGGSSKKKSSNSDEGEELSSSSQIIGIILLFISLCFDGGTGAYEDKLMSVHSVGPFDLMYNIQLGKTIIAGVSLLVLNQVHLFLQMCQELGFVLVALGLTGAMGQVFIFVTISKFGALTCSIIGLARKVTTLVASIYFYGHHLNAVQTSGLVVCVSAMVMNFMGKKDKGGHGHGGGGGGHEQISKEPLPAVSYRDNVPNQYNNKMGDVELPRVKPITAGGR